ncbi:hypothetical protein [Paremcibacter congregatus]|uniref:DUF2946 domain-containing protein n=1 Tax=Paremcibacter congregatus TaxID=2043170 RepID=A0A2G4YRJ7_9PROT|nr:hypothetical protein [Paremcibacter congregatus]PHZ84959.1 hypothetical protein CRD36_09560 [Paremcibacter congregatus]QDE26067.1 hypothetical protein FIV45_01585 [Paremcibacter congregatus]
MYGLRTPAVLSLILARLGRGVGQFMLSVMLLNIFAATALSAQSAAQMAAAEDDLFASTLSVVICTPQGLRRITLDENGEPVDSNDDVSGNCVHCLPCHKGALQAISTENGLSPVVILASYRFSFDTGAALPPTSSRNRACPPRAPPYA